MKTSKRIGAIIICLLLLVSGCGKKETAPAGKEQEPDAAKIQTVDLLEGDAGTLEQENYVLQHLEYLEGQEYQEILSAKHDLAGQASKAYEEANQAKVNKAWLTMSNVCMLVGDEELELTNEYDILLTDLMQSEAASENYRESYEKALCGAFEELLTDLADMLEKTKSNLDTANGEYYDKVGGLIDSTEKALNMVHSLRKEEKDELMPQLAVMTEKMKKEYQSSLGDQLAGFLDSSTTALDYFGDAMELTSTTFSEFVDKYLFYRAASAASEEWYETWKNIAERIKTDDSSEAERLYKSLNTILSEIDLGKNGEWEEMYKNAAKTLAEKNMFEYSAETASAAFDDVCKKWLCGRLIKKTFSVGASLANRLMNCDDIAYYGQMVLGAGILARNTYPVLLEAATELNAKEDYKSALYFDEVFHILKDIQVKGCDYAISFHQAIIENPAGYVLKYMSDDHAAEQYRILADKADWQGYECHGKVTDYYQFIHDKLLPDYGYVNVNKKSSRLTANDYYADVNKYNCWDKRTGLFAANIADLNMDGTEDLIVFYFDRKKSPGALMARIYSRDDKGKIYQVDTEQLTETTACEEYHCSAGLITLKDGIYLYTEENVTGKFIDYSDYVVSLYQLTDDGKWIRKYKMGQSGGGTSEVSYSLWKYVNKNKYKETVLWADSEYRVYHENVKIATSPGTSWDNAIALGFKQMGIPEMAPNSGQSEKLSYVLSLKYDVAMNLVGGNADFTSVLTDKTEFRKNMKPYDQEKDSEKGQNGTK